MIYKLELDEQTLDVISQAISQMPYRVAAPVVAELQKQINEQRPDLRVVDKEQA